MSNLKAFAIDLAWKTEGLPRYLKDKGEYDDEKRVNWAQAIALWDPLVAGIENIPSEEPSNGDLASACCVMMNTSRDYNYDSGKRRFDLI